MKVLAEGQFVECITIHQADYDRLTSKLAASKEEVGRVGKTRDYYCESLAQETKAFHEAVARAEAAERVVQEMVQMLCHGSSKIAELSASPAVAHLCMELRKKEAAEQKLGVTQ